MSATAKIIRLDPADASSAPVLPEGQFADLQVMFEERLQERRLSLHKAWVDGDRYAMKWVAHAIRGAAGFFDRFDLVKASEDVEASIEREDPLPELTRHIGRLLALIDDETSRSAAK